MSRNADYYVTLINGEMPKHGVFTRVRPGESSLNAALNSICRQNNFFPLSVKLESWSDSYEIYRVEFGVYSIRRDGLKLGDGHVVSCGVILQVAR